MVWIILGVVVALAIARLEIVFYNNSPKTDLVGPNNTVIHPPHDASTPNLEWAEEALEWGQTWIVSASEAKALIQQSNVVLLDARGLSRRVLTHIEGAIPVHWRSFSRSDASQQGKLLDYSTPNQRHVLEQTIRKLGISDETIVLVYGEPNSGWGEEGRMVWMFKTLGHDRTAWIDGGIHALINEGLKTSVLPSYKASALGNFHIQAQPNWTITHEELKDQLNSSRLRLVDTREAREYEGATPYGEQRGGHIPGAAHIYFKQLLADDGRLKSPREIQQILSSHNIFRSSEVVAYCTGGIRSAWFVSVLNDLGYAAKNYPGSAWEWAALSDKEYPLES